MQRGIERAGFDLEQIIRLRADRLTNAVAVLGSPLEGSENEHVEGSLEELQALVVGVCRHSRLRLVGWAIPALHQGLTELRYPLHEWTGPKMLPMSPE